MPGIAFVFAGQGAQYPGMGADLYDEYPQVREIYETAEKKIPGITGICFEGSKEELGKTVNTQPCIFLTETAISGILKRSGIKAKAAAGFSAGEIAALHFGGVMDFGQALDYTIFRAENMEAAASQNKGKMAAVIKLTSGDVEKICHEIGDVWAVNYNCPGQTVVSGNPDSVERVILSVTAAGGRAKLLDVSGAFHSPFMISASDAARDYLYNIKLNKPEMPLYTNISGEILPAEGMADQISAQIASPVLWEKTVRSMIRDGVDIFVEIGPGEVLSGLIRRIDPDVQTLSIGDVSGLESAADRIRSAEVRNA